ncbi:MAG: DNA polymerase III subunit gamma/tau [candidate division Zixibacteria bacterium]|nr:DNA polymerase III subunit gamma/tau [candidate division Zixibacteria bacterium]
MSYFVFSRKYRPQTFADVLAQHHVTETLTRAIENDRVSQAYLFCGVRGTGKTSVARILAKRLNCANPQGAEPCNQCDSCVGIIKGRSLDILEIDAASNTSVDDIRELRESIKYAPVGGKYKVYIIDEVHRLSPSAFDALLKTLEEPPAHVVFIFATTEVHKVPQTILSRCQRYDFRRVGETDLRQAIDTVAEKEDLKVSDEAMAELARRSDGSLRDALSLLDQVASWQCDIIDMDLLSQALGILPHSEYRAILQLIRKRQAADLIGRLDQVLKSGIDASEFVRGLQEQLRLMLLVKAAPEQAGELGVSDDDIVELKEIVAAYSLNDLLRIQNLLVNLDQKIRDGFDPRLNLELALLKLSNMESSITLEQILGELTSGSGTEARHKPVSTPASPEKQLELTNSAPAAPKRDNPTSSKVTVGSDANLADIWKNLLASLKKSHRSLHIKLTMAQPRQIEGDKLMVAFDRLGEFHVRQLQDREVKLLLEEMLKQVSGRDLKPHFFVDKELSPRQDKASAANLFTDSEKEDHPLVAKAISVFDARVVSRKDISE